MRPTRNYLGKNQYAECSPQTYARLSATLDAVGRGETWPQFIMQIGDRREQREAQRKEMRRSLP